MNATAYIPAEFLELLRQQPWDLAEVEENTDDSDSD